MSAIYALRMFGVYLATPVLSPYTAGLPGASPAWIGLSLGAYGFTQALFQVPFGALSDRFGRRLSLGLGLLVFGAGSAICWAATSAPALVLGRLVQGMGAMASTMIALFGDRTREGVRARAMAGMGIFVGGAFATGLVAGPWVASRTGVPSLFALSTGLTALGLLALPWALGAGGRRLPHTPRQHTFDQAVRAGLATLARPALLALDAGILLLHMGLTSIFVLLPFRLAPLVATERQGLVYAPALVLGFFSLWIASHAAETSRGARRVLLAGAAFLAAGLVLLARGGGLATIVPALCLYVIGFAAIEPALAAELTHQAEPAMRGTAAGVFNTVQFLGVFLGGLVAAAALRHEAMPLFPVLAGLEGVWLAAAWRFLDRPSPGARDPGSAAPEVAPSP